MKNSIPPSEIPSSPLPSPDKDTNAAGRGSCMAMLQVIAGFIAFFLIGIFLVGLANSQGLFIAFILAPIVLAIIPGTRWIGLGMLLALGASILLLVAICGNMHF